MEGVGRQDTCGAHTVHDYGLGEGEGDILRLVKLLLGSVRMSIKKHWLISYL